LTNKQEQTIRRAIENSREHNHDLNNNHTLCAILCDGSRMYTGYNKKKTHPLQKEFSKNEHAIYLHAEVDAIQQAYREIGNIEGYTLYIARTTVDGKIANAYPCKGCREAIEHFGIDKVFFTTENGYGLLQ
jgi:tRNA(Arg) A34 adenosine deaminase TadA